MLIVSYINYDRVKAKKLVICCTRMVDFCRHGNISIQTEKLYKMKSCSPCFRLAFKLAMHMKYLL